MGLGLVSNSTISLHIFFHIEVKIGINQICKNKRSKYQPLAGNLIVFLAKTVWRISENLSNLEPRGFPFAQFIKDSDIYLKIKIERTIFIHLLFFWPTIKTWDQ